VRECRLVCRRSVDCHVGGACISLVPMIHTGMHTLKQVHTHACRWGSQCTGFGAEPRVWHIGTGTANAVIGTGTGADTATATVCHSHSHSRWTCRWTRRWNCRRLAKHRLLHHSLGCSDKHHLLLLLILPLLNILPLLLLGPEMDLWRLYSPSECSTHRSVVLIGV